MNPLSKFDAILARLDVLDRRVRTFDESLNRILLAVEEEADRLRMSDVLDEAVSSRRLLRAIREAAAELPREKPGALTRANAEAVAERHGVERKP